MVISSEEVRHIAKLAKLSLSDAEVEKYSKELGQIAEFVAELRKLFEDNGVRYQISELGKVDEGGGGTIAYILANKGMDVIDCGTPVLSMHSPYEATSKYDVYMSYLAYKVFLK